MKPTYDAELRRARDARCRSASVARAVRAPVDDIPAPPFPAKLPWVNVAPLRMDKQRGRPVLVEFWDFCRVNSLRTLPYLKAWHERYAADGPARDRRPHARASRPRATRTRSRAAVARLGIEHPVVHRHRASSCGTSTATRAGRRATCGTRDGHAVRVPLRRGRLRRDRAARSRSCSASSASRSAPLRPEDEPERAARRPRRPTSPAPTAGPTRPAACGRCSSGAGELRVNGERGRRRAARRATCSSSTPHHTDGVLDLEVGDGVTCHATCFTPGWRCRRPERRRRRRPRAAARAAAAPPSSSSTAAPGQYGLRASRGRGTCARRPRSRC